MTSGKDIRYRGLLTYRGLRLVALMFMTVSQFCAAAQVLNKLAVIMEVELLSSVQAGLINIGASLGQMTFPLLLIASFGIVLSGTESIKKTLLTDFLLALLTYLATVLLLSEFIRVFLEILPQTMQSAAEEGAFGESLQQSGLGDSLYLLYERVVLKMLPGDGTIRLDFINRVLSEFGVSFQLPSLEKLESMIVGFGIPAEDVRAIVAAVSQLTPATLFQYAGELATWFSERYSIDYYAFFSDYVVPRLSALLVSRLNFNVFWDLFLYTSFYWFACGHPKKLRAGKLLLFRSCAVFPAGWLIISALLSATAKETLPVGLVAALSTRGLSALAVFFLIVLYQKYREAEYAERDSSGESWQAFLRTRRCSLDFSLAAGGVLCIVSLADFLLGKIPGLSVWGIGSSTMMWMAIPVLLLYSYTRKPKYKVLDVAVPAYYVAHYFLLLATAGGLLDRLYDLIVQ